MFKFSPGSKNLRSLSARFFLLLALALCSGLVQADIYRSLDPNTPRTFTNMRPAEGRWEIYFREKPTPIRKEPAFDQRRFTVDSRLRYASQIQAAAMANNVDAALIRAVIMVESGFNPSAVSSAGAVGLMQLMPGTAKRYNVTNSRDPAQNIHGGTRYLRDLLRMFNNDLHLAIAAYNAGEQAVMKYRNRIPPYRETLAYVPKVMKFYQRFSKDDVAAGKSGGKRVFAASRKKGTPIRVSWTYAADPA